MHRPLVVATTTMCPGGAQDLRGNLVLQCLNALKEAEITVVVVDHLSPPGFNDQMRDLGALVHPQTHKGMGNGRRQAISIASGLAGLDGFVLWMEPEKVGLVQFIAELLAFAIENDIDLVIPGRKTLEGYPDRQQTSEQLGNDFFADLTGRELDVYFGPRLMGPRAVQLFLGYNRKGQPDLWDCIFNPILSALHRGLRVDGYPVAYRHPSEQTDSEGTDLEMTLKRLDQVHVLSRAMHAFAEKIGLSKHRLS